MQTSDIQGTETFGPRTFERALSDGFRVTVVAGPDHNATASSLATKLTIGTDPTCDLILSCRATSRFHCEIEIVEGSALIRDLDSTNGTWIDGVRIVVAHLRRGAEVEIGRNRLRIERVTQAIGIELCADHQFGGLVGESIAMRAAFARMTVAAESSTTVLIHGETGTGKDTAAEAIHAASMRADQPFVVVDCASLPAGIAESELFGHRAGAFTGATADRAGVFEAAGSGTVFLDEIGELPLALQPKLLRVLERREIQRLGETQVRPIGARIIAATHRDLRRAVNTNRFRADLYFRIAVLTIEIPPLRARREDIALIVETLIGELAKTPAARERLRGQLEMTTLVHMEWPGNVRELRNHLERCLVLDHGESTAPQGAALPYAVAREAALHMFERQYLKDLLLLHGGSMTKAARHAEMHRTHLYRLVQRAKLP